MNKEKRVLGVKSRGNQARASMSLLSVKSHKTHLIPPMNYSNLCVVSLTREAH